MKWKVMKSASLDSTNEEALRFIANGKALEGWVLQTDEQTDGRGAGQNVWESEPGKNLTFSLILQPHFIRAEEQFVLTQCISLSLYHLLEKRLGRKDLFIKWPNDLWFQEKKIAGVLIQNVISGNQILYSVVGVGLNVNQKKFFSDAPNPASLVHFTGNEENPDALLHEVLQQFQIRYNALKKNAFAGEKEYLARLYRLGRWGKYRDENGVFEARMIGVNHYGQLLLRDHDGKERVYGFKEVEWIAGEKEQ